ncbi:MAG: pyruvate dehydrogenase (acetyl-transferring) E1 component subunit alpha [Candidatus Aenigmarchaeota archaeon]|nr:pyruvate dehydrogenase (acetyl-transferring) E1 component subunit alpha [Candidatus Aenigmarchaeota archaeon]
MRKGIVRFSVNYVQILDENGKCSESTELTNEQVKEIYELMVLSRIFDEKSVKLQREGRLGTYPPVRGQEAAQVASAYALDKKDWMIPAFRENASMIVRGLPMEMLLQYWGGDERGQKIPADQNNLTFAIPVGTQPLHAVGIAWASKIMGDKIASLVYFGDGATSEGDTSEAMNFAGVFSLPLVFACMNNQWAISVPRKKQTAAETIAQKAIAFGFDGIQVDGNDVFAVYKATKDALEKARSGKGPTLIELFTYRMGDHTTADDASRYRKKSEIDEWLKKDPIERLRKYMESNKLWTKDYEEKLLVKSGKKVEDAIKKYESVPMEDPGKIFEYVYAGMTEKLENQQKSLERQDESKS